MNVAPEKLWKPTGRRYIKPFRSALSFTASRSSLLAVRRARLMPATSALGSSIVPCSHP